MKKIINNLREQPEEVRRRILHIFTAVFAVILFSLWVVSLGRGFTNSSNEESIKEALEPFSNIKASAIDGYYSISP